MPVQDPMNPVRAMNMGAQTQGQRQANYYADQQYQAQQDDQKQTADLMNVYNTIAKDKGTDDPETILPLFTRAAASVGQSIRGQQIASKIAAINESDPRTIQHLQASSNAAGQLLISDDFKGDLKRLYNNKESGIKWSKFGVYSEADLNNISRASVAKAITGKDYTKIADIQGSIRSAKIRQVGGKAEKSKIPIIQLARFIVDNKMTKPDGTPYTMQEAMILSKDTLAKAEERQKSEGEIFRDLLKPGKMTYKAAKKAAKEAYRLQGNSPEESPTEKIDTADSPWVSKW